MLCAGTIYPTPLSVLHNPSCFSFKGWNKLRRDRSQIPVEIRVDPVTACEQNVQRPSRSKHHEHTRIQCRVISGSNGRNIPGCLGFWRAGRRSRGGCARVLGSDGRRTVRRRNHRHDAHSHIRALLLFEGLELLAIPAVLLSAFLLRILRAGLLLRLHRQRNVSLFVFRPTRDFSVSDRRRNSI
jgi:hypothetical protein